MIRVACPHCSRTYRTLTEGMGKTAVCTRCHHAFRIGEARPKFEWKPSDLGEDSWVGVAPPEEKKEIKHCIICDAPLEEGAVRCMECGANQVTGVVRKSRREGKAGEPSILGRLPLRGIIIGVAVVLAGAGAFYGIRAVTESATRTGEELVYQGLAGRAVRFLRQNSDEQAFAREFRGQVDDRNLAGYVDMISAEDPDRRQAVTLLIGCGNAKHMTPIIAVAESDAGAAREVLEAIGPRRLAELSGDADASVRMSAARGLCHLFELEPDEETVRLLSAEAPFAAKVHTLNGLCRPWPRAVGAFDVIIGETQAPFSADVEQIGRVFYLNVGSGSFRSSFTEDRTFHIPLERWCAATGPAVDVDRARRLLDGEVTIVSPYGGAWEGTVRVRMKQRLTGPVPGFLPIEPPPPGETLEVPIFLEHPDG